MTHYESLEQNWAMDKRWEGILRPYKAEDVVRLRGTLPIEHTFAQMGAKRLWEVLHQENYVAALGAVTGNQAVEQVRAGLRAVYVSGWQVAADANEAQQSYPDQSLYPVGSVPHLVRRINNAFQRADQIQHAQSKIGQSLPAGRQVKSKIDTDWFAPIVADAEAGFGGTLNAFELMKAMIEAGAAAVHWEDQLASAKKCGHMGGKVLVPSMEFVQKLVAVRFAADILGVSTLVIARTDANGAHLITSDIDPRDQRFLTGERTVEGFFRMKGGLEAAIARGLTYAPYSDMIWCETSEPNLEEAKKFAESILSEFPGKLLMYNCSPSFNWKLKLDASTIAKFQRELGVMGYKFQFVTLAGFHALNHSMFELAKAYQRTGMSAYADLQEREFRSEKEGYQATRHQEFVGTGYFDQIAQIIAGGNSSILALKGSTEEVQFNGKKTPKG
ncbi:MAG: isocitrate lyase [Elusimicrobia bacterium]|nr:isocitrate lyase [Elusimicrobiota bacterium]